jgi:signal transduction histidine kinase
MRPTLATTFSWAILGIVALSLASSLVAVYGAWRVNVRLQETARDNLPTVRAEEAEVILDDRAALLANLALNPADQDAEKNLAALDGRFRDWIAAVRSAKLVTDDEAEFLRRLERTWGDLHRAQNRIVSLIKRGDLDGAKALLVSKASRETADQARQLCDQLIAANNHDVQFFMGRAAARVQNTTLIVGAAGILTFILGGFLLWLFFYRVLFPLRGLVADAQSFRGAADDGQPAKDELRSMGAHLRSLMSDVLDTRTRLDHSRERLLAAEKLASVGKIAASVAHEIRNPLTAMKMWLFSLQESANGDAAMAAKLRIVSEEIDRLEGIVRNFLDFSRPAPPQLQSFDCGELLNATVELLAPRLAEQHIHVERSEPAEAPAVRADPAQLKQVLLNLLNNAADAMPNGGEIRLVASVEEDAEGRNMVVLRVSDTGGGMPAEVQRRVFEPFFTTKESGTGLGLSIAAQTMARQGGAIVLESSGEHGSTFAVWTPVAVEEARAQNSRS